MRQVFTTFAFFVAFTLAAFSQSAVIPNPFEINSMLGRGVNLGNLLDVEKEGDAGIFLQPEYFSVIKQAGFQSVRLTIRWSAHALSEPPYTIDETLFKRVDWAIEQALSNGLAIIIDVHHYREMMFDPVAHKERFLALWDQIGARYAAYSDSLLFEPLNEPHDSLTAELWNEYLAEAVKRIRKTNPDRTLFIGIAEWGGITAMNALRIPEGEKNCILSVHYYEPFKFTHQGAEWMEGTDEWLGTEWLGTDAEKKNIDDHFARILLWAKERNLPVNIGEFGAYYRAPIESRIRWTSCIVELCKKNNLSYHYWEFCSSFGFYNPETKEINEPLLNALLGK